MIVHNSFCLAFSPENPLRASLKWPPKAPREAQLQLQKFFRRNDFILVQVCLTRRHFSTYSFSGKSLELAARVTLLTRVPVNYGQLSRNALAF